MNPKTLNRNELAARLGVTNRTLDKYVKQEGFPKPIPLPGRAKRWDAETVEKFVKGGER